MIAQRRSAKFAPVLAAALWSAALAQDSPAQDLAQDGARAAPATTGEARTERRAELRRLGQRHGDSAFGQLELARVAREWGLDADMWRHLDACLATGSPSEGLQKRLDALLDELAADIVASADPTEAVEAQVRRLVRSADADSPARCKALERALARIDGAGTPLRRQARSAGSPTQRMTALRALAATPEPGADKFVFRAAILDSSDDVRAEAMRTPVAQHDPDTVIGYLAPGLESSEPAVRVRTAEAFANLGVPAAIPVLVEAATALTTAAAGPLPGGSTRGYMAVINQQAYIRDFDVEVAQAAFIADPQIDVLQSGVVLDVTVHAVTTMRVQLVRAYRGALQRLAGSDPGPDPHEWARWLAARTPAEPAATTPTAPPETPAR